MHDPACYIVSERFRCPEEDSMHHQSMAYCPRVCPLALPLIQESFTRTKPLSMARLCTRRRLRACSPALPPLSLSSLTLTLSLSLISHVLTGQGVVPREAFVP